MRNSLTSFEMSGPRRRLVIIGGIYVLLWLLAWHSAILMDRAGGVSLWYLPAGLRFFCLLVLGWPGLLLETVTYLSWGLLQLALTPDHTGILERVFYQGLTTLFIFVVVIHTGLQRSNPAKDAGLVNVNRGKSGQRPIVVSERMIASSVAAACSSKLNFRQKRLRKANPQARLMRLPYGE